MIQNIVNEKNEWRTMPEFFEFCNRRFGPYNLDAAANNDNALCKRFLTDALTCNWHAGKIWLNPPFSMQWDSRFNKYIRISDWIDYAIDQLKIKYAKHITILAPAVIGEKWFNKLYKNCSFIYLLNPRLPYCNSQGMLIKEVPFASALYLLTNPYQERNAIDAVIELLEWKPHVNNVLYANEILK